MRYLIIILFIFINPGVKAQKNENINNDSVVITADTLCNGGKVSLIGNSRVCLPGYIQFSATIGGGNWSSSNISAVGTINQNGLFTTGTNAGTTKIMYIVTNNNACSDTAYKWISIFYKPNAGSIAGDSVVCRGNRLQFSSNGNAGGRWVSSNVSAVGTINQTGSFTTGTNAGTTKIMYIVTNSNGCSDTASKWITIKEKPSAGFIIGAAKVCLPGTIQFSSTGNAGGTWLSSNISAVGTINQNGLFTTGTNAGTTKIMYVVTNSNGCSDTASKWISIFYKPNAGAIMGDSVVCRGSSLQFSSNGTSGGRWISSNISAVGRINQNGFFTTGTNAGTTKIMYIVTNSNGCSDTASKWITIKEKPSAGFIIGAAKVCLPGTIQFSSTGPAGGTWLSSNISAVGTIGQNGIFTTGTNAGTTKIMYVVTNSNGCSDTASKWISIFYKPNAGTITGNTVLCLGDSVQFTTNGTAGGRWVSSNISAVGTINQNGQFTSASRAGTTKIMYIVTNSNGCSDTAFKWIRIQYCTPRNITYRPVNHTNITKDEVVVFPNPSNTHFNLLVKNNEFAKNQIRVVNQLGETVYRSINKNQIIFGENFAPGMYFIEIRTGNTNKIIKATKCQ